MYAVVFDLIPLLLDRGLPPRAKPPGRSASAASGRPSAASSTRQSHTTPPPRDAPRSSSSRAAPPPLLIALIPGPPGCSPSAAITAGTVRGNLTLLQATAVTDRWGTTHYARLTATPLRARHHRRRARPLGRLPHRRPT